ncbi:MAG: ABC transporter ATP-binding protein [Phycisphaerales bacterium]|nr:ABC transporter ATP-binding protein [Phycisphaerales bacterium]
MATNIRLERLTKQFDAFAAGGGGGKGAAKPSHTVAVDDVTLTINAGELFFLLGPSGCGKTTLLRMIAGFLEPTSGLITFERVNSATGAIEWSRDMTNVPPNKRNTGMVFQSYALWPHMTVAQNVAFGLNVRKVVAAERDRRVAEALDAVQMGQYAQRRPNQLSGGQQQRVALARALVIRPDVLLLDEPLSNLDAKLRIELRSEIRRICKQSGITGVYVTHDQKEALSMADRVAIVNRGRVVQVGPPDELYRRPSSPFVAEFLGETNFIPARFVEQQGRHIAVQTPIGRLVGTSAADSIDSSTNLVVSLRPEAVRINTSDGRNNMFGRVEASTYLGETAQLLTELAGSSGEVIRIRASLLNPRAGTSVGEKVTLSADPDDLVVLPAARVN